MQALGVGGDIIPLLLHIADKPIDGVVTFECDPRIKAGRSILSVDSGINNGPVVSIDPVGVVENFTYRAEIGICHDLTFAPTEEPIRFPSGVMV
jgi:hypothetical protein